MKSYILALAFASSISQAQDVTPDASSSLKEAFPFMRDKTQEDDLEFGPASSEWKFDDAGLVKLEKPQQRPQSLVVYFQSWSAPASLKAADHPLANLPLEVKTVVLAFAKPDLDYHRGKNNFEGTGLYFSSSFDTVKNSIKILKMKNPEVRVLLSVGGRTNLGWDKYRVDAVSDLVLDLGLDGVDIDFEPVLPGCTWDRGGDFCKTDGFLKNMVQDFRSAIPRPLQLTAAVWSTGAFGTQKYPPETFKESLKDQHFGLWITPLLDVGGNLDALFVMSYNAGSVDSPKDSPTGYLPELAFDAYKEIYKGELFLGLRPSPEAWGSNETSLEEAASRAVYVRDNGGSGIMIWSFQNPGKPEPIKFIQTICRTLSLKDCQSD